MRVFLFFRLTLDFSFNCIYTIINTAIANYLRIIITLDDRERRRLSLNSNNLLQNDL